MPNNRLLFLHAFKRLDTVLTLSLVFVLLGCVASWVSISEMRTYVEEDIGETLFSVMESTEDTLDIWLEDKFEEMTIYAEHPEVLAGIESLLDAYQAGRGLKTEPALQSLRSSLGPWINRIDAKGFFVFAPDGVSLASMRDENIGVITPLAHEADMFKTCLRGQREFIKPFRADVELQNINGELTKGEPTMFLLVPIIDDQDSVAAIFALRLDPAGQLSKVVRTGRIGQTGDFFLFDRESRLITESRFNNQLREAGLLGADQRSALNIQLDAPEENNNQDHDATAGQAELTPTLPGKTARSQRSEVDINGYTGYRGIPVVGITSWNHKFDFGLGFEMEHAEAYEPYTFVRNSVLFASCVILVLILTSLWLLQSEKIKAIAVSRSLEQSDAKFRLVLDSMADATIIFDIEGKIRFWPKSARDMFGFPESQALGMNAIDMFIEGPYRQKVIEEIKLVKATGEGTIFNQPREFVARTADGGSFPAEHLTRIIQINGSTMAVSVIRDISRRKEVEANLVKRDNQLREAQHIAKLGHWEADYPSKRVHLSEEGFKIFGLKSQALVPTNKAFLRMVHPDDLQAVKTAYREWMQRQGKFSIIHRIVMEDSTVKTIHQRGRSLLNEKGELVRVVGTVQDISERIEKEKELRLLTERLQLATHSALVGVWDWDLVGNSLYWNDTMFTMYGIAKEDFTGNIDAWESMLYPDDMEDTHQQLQQAIDGNKAFHTIFRIRRPDGEIRHIEATAKTVKDKHGKAVRMVGSNLDVTDQVEANLILKRFNEELENRIRTRTVDMEKANKAAISILKDANRSKMRAEDALEQLRLSQAEQQKLSAAVKSSPAVVMVMNADWTIEYVNPRFTELTGYSMEEVIGETTAFLKPEGQSEEMLQAICDQLMSGKTWEGELQSRKKDGTVFWEHASFSPILSDEGVVTHYVSVKEDITKRKEAQRRIEAALLQVEMASNAKSEFLANMSHEIRTPMNAILGFTDILDRKLEDPTHRRYLNSIKSSGRLLLNLINDILDLSKVEAGKLEMSYAPVDFSKLMGDTQQVFAQKAKEKDLKILMDISDKIPRVLVLDETRLRQVLVNLVGNAIKFTEEGHVKLSATAKPLKKHPERLKLTIAIEDTGVGIPEEEISRIFEAFEQVKDKQFTNREGTGLGLAISSNLVDLMNGDISVKSTSGGGSVFTVTLNDVEISKEKELSISATKGAPAKRLVFEPATILVADDIEDNRDLIKGYFEDYPFEVLEAENGEQACELAMEHIPDLILMDMKMPVLSGTDATLRLKQNTATSEIPIVALTASAMTRSAKRIAKTCDGYLRKPVPQDELIEVVAEFLPHSHIVGDREEQVADATGWSLSLDEDELKLYRQQDEYIRKQAEKAALYNKTMPMDQIENFATNLEQYAASNSLDKLSELAKSLQDQVLMFELDGIKSILKLIANLPKQLGE